MGGQVQNECDPDELFCLDLPTQPRTDVGTVLVTGATGYIGGRLVPELLARGYHVRVMVRAASIEHKSRWPKAQIAVADALFPESLAAALSGVDVAYYLIHSLNLGPRLFADADTRAAAHFGREASAQGVKRIIYLGGLGDRASKLSKHLESRLEVVRHLQQGGTPVTILRAAVVMGSGSASYEIIKHLVKNLPIMLLPKWARTKCQPIAVRDVIKYLVGLLETPESTGGSYDIGGRDILSYQQMLQVMAEIHKKKILFIKSPLSLLRTFSYVASLVTPVPDAITRSLFASLNNEVICQCDEIHQILKIQPIGYRESIIRAMTREEQDRVYTRWSDGYPPAHELALKLHDIKEPLAFIAKRCIQSRKKATALFQSICKIGGKDGWFHNNWMWRLRGFVDRLLLGVGSSRGRRSQHSLQVNDVIGFWRVEDLVIDQRLLLRAEMKLPGRAWLEFSIRPLDDSFNQLGVTAYFDTSSRFGKLYWYFFKPFHYLIFANLIKQIDKRAEDVVICRS